MPTRPTSITADGLKVWVIKTGEPLPIDETVRPLRAAAVARALAERGADVTLWASTFSHQLKRHVFPGQTETSLGPRLTLIALHGPSYSANVSIARFRNHRTEARAFLEEASRRAKPDVIVAAMPTLDLAEAAVAFGNAAGIPVIVDIRDQWPDALLFRLPRPLRQPASWGLAPFHRQLRRTVRGATAVFAISEGMLNWGLGFAGRQRSEADCTFRSAYSPTEVDADAEYRAIEYWRGHGVLVDPRLRIAVYAGTLTFRAGHRLVDVIKTFRTSGSDLTNWRLVICGAGPLLPELKSAASGDHRVIFSGWVGSPELSVILRRSDIGLLPYPNEPDFLNACPNKFAEYLCHGVPVASLLEGEVGRMIKEKQCGYVCHDAQGILAAARQIDGAPRENPTMRGNARALYENSFDGTIIYSAFAQVVFSLATAKTPPTARE